MAPFGGSCARINTPPLKAHTNPPSCLCLCPFLPSPVVAADGALVGVLAHTVEARGLRRARLIGELLEAVLAAVGIKHVHVAHTRTARRGLGLGVDE
eukprot:363079-Chlamydomonas_euryale.AAC.9